MNAYSFLPWLRRGIATRITTPPGAGPRVSVPVTLDLAGPGRAGGGTVTREVSRDVQLYGPGDVVGVDDRAIVRTEPRDWITDFDPNLLAFAEFYDEDFPWRYSPDVADPATGRLRPWLALVVLTEAEFAEGTQVPGAPLPAFTTPGLGVFPPAEQLGAWVHVQVNRTVTASDQETVSADMGAVLPRLAGVLAENPDLAGSRVVCPRHLDPEQGYHAFLVPAFETGRLAGLGLDPAGAPGALQSSWVDYPGRPQPAGMPFYHRWRFRTSTVGDFEYLVRLLTPRPVDARVGGRDMDVRTPGAGLPGITDPALGGVLRLGGALAVPESDLDPAELAAAQAAENWDRPFPHPFQQALAALIDLGTDYRSGSAAAGPDPLVTPPLYGRWHALTSRLLTGPDGTLLDPDESWVNRLNLDPRFRVAAGFGARVVREHQEEFMAAAWRQVGDVLAANKRIRAAQVAREIGHSLHTGHLTPLTATAPGRLLALTAPLQARLGSAGPAALAGGPAVNVATALADSTVGAAPLSPAMRRAARPGSRLVRGLPFAGAADRDALLDKINSGQVTAAPPKAAPASIVTVDALEAAISGPIIELRAAADQIPDPVDGLPDSPDFVVSLPGEGVHPVGGATDSAEAARFKQALHEVYAAFNVAADAGFVPPRVPADLAGLREAALAGLHPDRTVARRVFGSVTLPGRFLPGPVLELAADDTAPPLTEVMTYPVIDLPMYRPLLDLGAESFLPNLNLVAHNSITLLDTNRRFVESYLVGLNHEMAREMLWREFPTDQRGSVFRQFWDVRGVLPVPGETPDDRRERLYDITPIDTWQQRSVLGGHQNRFTTGDEVALVIRGELLKKFPTAVVYAHRADWHRLPDGSIDLTRPRHLVDLTDAEQADPPPGKVRMPLYDAKAEPDIYLFGFDLTEAQVRGGTGDHPDDDPGWFFVIKERPGDTRFGLDVERDTALRVWDDLAWPDVLPQAAGTGPVYLPLDASAPTITLTDPGDPDFAVQFSEDVNLTFGPRINAADLAYILFRAPVLVAIHAREMLGDG